MTELEVEAREVAYAQLRAARALALRCLAEVWRMGLNFDALKNGRLSKRIEQLAHLVVEGT